jgi:hypothetical protein
MMEILVYVCKYSLFLPQQGISSPSISEELAVEVIRDTERLTGTINKNSSTI